MLKSLKFDTTISSLEMRANICVWYTLRRKGGKKNVRRLREMIKRRIG
jgi:hypothetical protein